VSRHELAVLRALESLERALYDGEHNCTEELWMKLGKLMFENRELIDANGRFGFPDSPRVLHLPTIWEQRHSEQAARDAAITTPSTDYHAYCWAAMGCMNRSTVGPHLEVSPGVIEVLLDAMTFVKDGVIWRHKPAFNFFLQSESTTVCSREKYQERHTGMFEATKEVIRFLKAIYTDALGAPLESLAERDVAPKTTSSASSATTTQVTSGQPKPSPAEAENFDTKGDTLRKAKKTINQPPMTDGQKRLWDALKGRALTGKELASSNELDTSQETIRQWVGELKKAGYEIPNRRGRGYYRPDAPPLDGESG